MIRLRRIYDPPVRGEGERFLVERLWPRGVRKEDAHLTAWLKEVAPSAELRKWYAHDVARWPEFQKRYRAELRDAAHRPVFEELKAHAGRGNVTLLYAAKDEEHNSALVLKQVLESEK